MLPDGAGRLVFNLGDAPSAGPGHRIEAMGASAAPSLVRLSGRMDGVTIALRAGAASALLEIPAGELTDNAEHLDELWQGEGARVLERLAEAPNDGARVQVVQQALACASNVETAPPTEPHAVRLCS